MAKRRIRDGVLSGHPAGLSADLLPDGTGHQPLDQGRCREARDLLARTREEVDRLIESPRAVTLHLEEADS